MHRLSIIRQIILLTSLTIILSITVVLVLFYSQFSKTVDRLVSERLLSLATGAASQIDGDVHSKIIDDFLEKGASVNQSKEYETLHHSLKQFKTSYNLSSDILTVIAPDWANGNVVFIGTSSNEKYLGNGIPASVYVKKALKEGTVQTTSVYQDTEGVWVSAFAPIMGSKGFTNSVVEVDYNVAHEVAQTRKVIYTVIGIAVGLSILLGGIGIFSISKVIKKQMNTSAKDFADKIEKIVSECGQLIDRVHLLGERTNLQFKTLESTITEVRHIEISSQETLTIAQNMKMAMSQNQTTLEEGRVSLDSLKQNLSQMQSQNKELISQIESLCNQFSDVLVFFKNIQSESKIVTDIAFQTRIISFNASVEASRAGEFGKGFSVVASEVGTLATVSNQAAVSINNLVTQSITNTDNTLKESYEKKNQTTKAVDKLDTESQKVMTSYEGATFKIEEATSKTIDNVQTTFLKIGDQQEQLTALIRQFKMFEENFIETIESTQQTADEINQVQTEVLNLQQSFVDFVQNFLGKS